MCFTINLAGGLRGDVKWMKQAPHQSVCCLFGGRDAGIRHTPKVKLICFVDTLVTLTSVNIEPAILFFFLPVATNSGAIHHAARAGAGDCVLWHISMLA